MRVPLRFAAGLIGLVCFLFTPFAVLAEYAGPFVPHPGMQITTTFTNEFGRDAEAITQIAAVTSEEVDVQYFSTRGMATKRKIRIRDRISAGAYVLGYAAKMPVEIPGTTSLGISAAVLSELRSKGQAALQLVYSVKLDRIDCILTTIGVDVKVPVIVEDRVFEVPTVQARAECGSGKRNGTGLLTFANDVNNPVLIESVLDFSWENQPRTERVTRVVAGLGLHRDMQKSLSTLGTYEVYGLHFDFDSANLRKETAQLVRDIAAMLEANPNWVIEIAGHTDSVGGADYNLELSGKRAMAIRDALIREGIAPNRLKAVGYGMSKPKADNGSLAGRAINRRAEFRRLDR